LMLGWLGHLLNLSSVSIVTNNPEIFWRASFVIP
jgi:hypothetical protein